jgi:hypothetical protein
MRSAKRSRSSAKHFNRTKKLEKKNRMIQKAYEAQGQRDS